MNIPEHIADIEFHIGDEDGDGQVDVGATVTVLGYSIVNVRKNVDLATAFRLLSTVKATGSRLKELLT
jgi:hypothetical protein